MMRPTEEQAFAIDTHDKNIILVAGAGSGKTRVLVERFLALLDANRDWSLNALVAITFTEKAAREMRDRVRLSLEERQQNATAPQDRQHWSMLLASMDSARIGTIHSLCGNILRANAAEAGLDPKFDVLDETESTVFLENVVTDVLGSLQNDIESSRLLDLFEVYEAYQIKKVLLDEKLMDFPLPELHADLLAHWQTRWQDELRLLVTQLRTDEALQEALRWKAPNVDASDAFLPVWQQLQSDCQTLLTSVDAGQLVEAIQRLADVKVNTGRQANWGGKEVLALAKEHAKLLREWAKAVFARLGEPPQHNDIDKQMADYLPLWHDLIKRVQIHFSEAKLRQDVLDFNDLEQRTLDLLETHEDVRKRYQGKEFKHLLVDEFQDTNDRQWRIIKALSGVENAGSLFVVGDPKQSIYAFRGADVSVFEAVTKEITRNGGERGDLSQSFRTHKPLVDGFNRLFGALMVRDESSPVSAYQVRYGKAMDAFRKSPPEQRPHIEYFEIPSVKGDGLNAEQYRQQEAYAIARRLRDMVENGYEIYDKRRGINRPLVYGDVAILFQALSSVNLYEDVFRAEGVPFITIAGRGYYERREVHDLLNLLRALHNPADDLSLATALRSPLFGLSDDALYALRLARDEDGERFTLWQALSEAVPLLPDNERDAVQFARETLHTLHNAAGRITIYELLRQALNATGYLATISGLSEGDQRRGNVLKLLDKAQASELITMSKFRRYLDDLSAREIREGDAALDVADVVQIMSVHKSKGLEFPVVVLGDISWSNNRSLSNSFVYDDDLTACMLPVQGDDNQKPYIYNSMNERIKERDYAERKRLLYVAATRAQDALLISGRASNGANQWMAWLQPLLEAESDEFVTIHELADLPAPEDFLQKSTKRNSPLWNTVDMVTFNATTSAPYLLQDIHIQRQTQAKHISASAIGDLGSIATTQDAERDYYLNRFRRQIFYNAPATIHKVTAQQHRATVPARIVGDMVHKALQFWQLPDGTPEQDEKITALLQNYAWEQGLTVRSGIQKAVKQAFDLLENFRMTTLYAQIIDAEHNGQVFRELPFIYEHTHYTIHGIIDLLMQRADGSWVIVDYKTSKVNQAEKHPQNITEHARRYHLQVALYAQALRALLQDTIPETWVHYVRYDETVNVSFDARENALQLDIEKRLDQVLSE